MEREELKALFEAHGDAMTPAQRARAYAAGEEVDHIPFSLQSNEAAMAGLFGYTTAQWRDDPAVHIDIIRRRRDEFGIEGLSAGLHLRTVAHALGARLFFPEVGIDRVEAPAIQSLDELGRIEDSDPCANPVYLGILERARILKDAFPEMGMKLSIAGPITAASAIMPIEELLRATRKDPQGVRALLDVAVRHSLAFAKMFAGEFGSVSCGVSDPVSCADVLSRKQYEEFSLPFQHGLIDGLARIIGRKPGLHICGRTNPFWDEIATLEVASFSVDDCESLADAKERIGDRFMLVGNVPPVDVMLNGTIDDVVASCKGCIRDGAESPLGYTLGTGCQVPIGTPRQNIEAFIYAARTYGRGARKGCMPRGMKDNENCR